MLKLQFEKFIHTHIYLLLYSLFFRYVMKNSKAYAAVGKSYDPEVPQFLHNRPPSFMAHCLNKIELGRNISLHDIKSQDNGTYEVYSKDSGSRGNIYTVSLQGDGSLPSCNCHSWKWSHLPCKHMFAVLFQIPHQSWESIPEAYRSSPYFTIDTHLFSVFDSGFTFNRPQSVTSNISPSNEMSADDCASEEEVRGSIPCSFKRPQSALRGAAATCREKLARLQDATYMCQDVKSLNALSDILDKALDHIYTNLYDPNGMVPDPQASPAKNSRTHVTPACEEKKMSSAQHLASHVSLNKFKRKRLSRRVGKKADSMKKQRLDGGIKPTKTYKSADGVASLPHGCYTETDSCALPGQWYSHFSSA